MLKSRFQPVRLREGACWGLNEYPSFPVPVLNLSKNCFVFFYLFWSTNAAKKETTKTQHHFSVTSYNIGNFKEVFLVLVLCSNQFMLVVVLSSYLILRFIAEFVPSARPCTRSAFQTNFSLWKAEACTWQKTSWKWSGHWLLL